MNILPITAIFFSSLLARKATGSWFSPGAFFGFSWLFFVVTPILFAPEFHVNTYGLWFISLFVMSLSSGSIATSFFAKPRSEILLITNEKHINRLINYLHVFNFVSFSGLIGLIIYINSFYSIENESFWIVSNLISVDRYGDNLSYPILIKYALYFIYPGNIISGILLNYKTLELKNKIICILPLFLSIGLGALEGSRTSILLSIVLFSSSWIGLRILKNQGHLNLSFFKSLVLSLTLFSIFVFFFILVQWLRQGMNLIIYDLIIERLRAYFFGYLSAFTQWFSSIESSLMIDSIMTTFAGPMNLLGLINRDLGFYSPIRISDNVTTNIFTALRSIVSDFSILGSLIIAFILGVFFQFQFQKSKEYEFDGLIWISIFYSFTLYSPLISIFHYNSIFFSWLIIYVIYKTQ